MDEVQDSRISKLRDYLFDVINNLTEDRNYQINANILSDKVDDYSLDKIPTNTEAEKPWIIGVVKRRDVYSLKSRKSYSQDTLLNLQKMGFFEQFENAIKTNNNEGNLPNIDNVESIKCLNPFTMIDNVNGNKATFDIQIEITYRDIL